MSFLYPAFLFALSVIIIPVLIHLFRFRRYKIIRFPDLRFLKSVFNEQKNRNRLKHLLVLFARSAALICLVLAFAIPGCNLNKQAIAEQNVVVFIDNSYSMDVKTGKGLVIESAKESARRIVSGYGNAARFRIMTQNFDASKNSYLTSDEALNEIDEIAVSSASGSLKKTWNNIFSAELPKPTDVYMISDFQQSFLNEIPENKPESTVIYGVQVSSEETSNVSLDSAWLSNPFALPGETNELHFRVINYGDNEIETGVRLSIGGELAGVTSVGNGEGGKATGSIAFKMPSTGYITANLSIDDNGFDFDDQLNLVLNSGKEGIVELSTANVYVDSVLSKIGGLAIKHGFAGSTAAVTVVEMISPPGNQTIEKWVSDVRNGRTLLLFPSPNLSTGAYSSLEKWMGAPHVNEENKTGAIINKADLSHPFFDRVFKSVPNIVEMPSYQKYFSTSGALGNGEKILGFQNGDPLLLRFRMGKGKIYLFMAPLHPEAGNLVRSVLFFPVMANCVIPANEKNPLYATVFSSQAYPLNESYGVLDGKWVVKFDGNEFVPEIQQSGGNQELYIGNQFQQAGIYKLTDKSSGKTVEFIAVNNSRIESNPALADQNVLNGLEKMLELKWLSVDRIEGAVAGGRSGSPLWRLFIWLAASFFAMEVLILVFWDRAMRYKFKTPQIRNT